MLFELLQSIVSSFHHADAICVFGSAAHLSGCNIQKLTDVSAMPQQQQQQRQAQSVAEKTAMVRAARQLLSAITKVLILADKVVVKQVLAAKDKVR